MYSTILLVALGFCWQIQSQMLIPRNLKSVVYFTSWSSYSGYQPSQIPTDFVTHINYASTQVSETGEITLLDPAIDINKIYNGDNTTGNGTNVFGNVKQLFLLKKRNRHIKVLLSVGGTVAATNISKMISNPESRSNFVRSGVHLVQDLGFDGLDIDWGTPADSTQATDFVSLLEETRQQLSNSSSLYNANHTLLLSATASAQPEYYRRLQLKQMDQYLDYWYLAGYNLGTANSTNVTHHQANLFRSNGSMTRTPLTIDDAVRFYINTGGISGTKLVLGMPLFGNGYSNTTGIGLPGDPIAASEYLSLPLPQATEIYDSQAVAAYSLDSTSQILFSYDNLDSASQKLVYATSLGLGGFGWWSVDGDKHGSQSVIETVSGLVISELDQSINNLNYTNSGYMNLRDGFPGQ